MLGRVRLFSKYDCTKWAQKRSSVFTSEHLNPLVQKMEDMIQGPLVMLADQMDRQLRDGVDLPFKKLLRADADDLHSMGQPPLTFYRQVLALVTYPALIDKADFPDDVKQRADNLLLAFNGRTIGSYTREVGLDQIRCDVASCLQRRDRIPCNYRNIVLVPDNVSAFKLVLKMLMKHDQEITNKQTPTYPGVMCPVPFIPSYQSALTELRAIPVKYYLDEGRAWSIDVKELRRAYEDSDDEDLRVLFVSNPGNPTGQVLTKSTMQDIIRFAKNKKLMIFADEVHQEHIYKDNKFLSFKKVVREMGPKYQTVELASLTSSTGGCAGEGGLRGGALELVNLRPERTLHLHNLITTDICLSTLSQCLLSSMALPPKPGDASYNLYAREQDEIRSGLQERMEMMVDGLNQIPGYRCHQVQGGIFAYPSLDLSPKCVTEAARTQKHPDQFYAQKLLTRAGVLVVPGSSCQQCPATYHLRCTVPPSPKTVTAVITALKDFHKTFTKIHT